MFAIAALGLAFVASGFGTTPQAAATPAGGGQPGQSAPVQPGTPPVDVLQVSGYLDPILVRKIERAMANAERDGSQALVLQLNSRGSLISDREAAELATRIKISKVPVAIWVGPSGARAYGHSGQLLGAALVNGMAPGTTIGRFGDPLVVDGTPLAFGEATARLRGGTLNSTEARSAGALKPANDQGVVAVLGEMIVALDGVEANGTTLQTATDVVADDGRSGRSTSGLTRFVKLNLVEQMMHTFASPPIAYLFLILGLGLLLFEFFTAGVGVAGVTGALFVIAASYGISALPTRPLAIAMMLLAFVAFAVDVQTGVPRFWTGVGVVLFVLASVFFYRGISLSWVSLLVGIGGMLLTFISGMPSMVRTRFATPTIGREFMIGRTGEAIEAVNPEGVVQIGEGRWRARANRATPIAVGGRVSVVAIDGLTLEVEPEGGGARDYRERRPKSSKSDTERSDITTITERNDHQS